MHKDCATGAKVHTTLRRTANPQSPSSLQSPDHTIHNSKQQERSGGSDYLVPSRRNRLERASNTIAANAPVTTDEDVARAGAVDLSRSLAGLNQKYANTSVHDRRNPTATRRCALWSGCRGIARARSEDGGTGNTELAIAEGLTYPETRYWQRGYECTDMRQDTVSQDRARAGSPAGTSAMGQWWAITLGG